MEGKCEIITLTKSAGNKRGGDKKNMYLLFFFYIKRPAGLRCAPLRGRRGPLPLLRFLSFFFVRVKVVIAVVMVEVVFGYIVPTLQQRAILNLWNGKCEIEYAAKSAGKKRGGGGQKISIPSLLF